MPKQPEVRAKDAIKATLNEVCARRGLHHKGVWNAGAAFGVATLDYTGVVAGHALVIEAKRFDGKGKGATTRQKVDLEEFRVAGAATWLIDSELVLKAFRHWLENLVPRQPAGLP